MGKQPSRGGGGTAWNGRRPLSWSVLSYLLSGPLQMAERPPGCAGEPAFRHSALVPCGGGGAVFPVVLIPLR